MLNDAPLTTMTNSEKIALVDTLSRAACGAHAMNMEAKAEILMSAAVLACNQLTGTVKVDE